MLAGKLFPLAIVIFSAGADQSAERLNGRDWDMRVRRDLSKLSENTPLVVTTILRKPYAFLPSDPSDDRLTGYIPEILTILSTRYTFSYEIRVVEDSRYGSQQQDGSWNGMIGEIVRGEADLAAAPLLVTSQREKVVDFVKPFTKFGYTIILKKPELTYYTFNLLEPFATETWIILVVAFVVTWLFMWAMNRFNPYENSQVQQRENAKGEISLFGFGGAFWYIFTLTNWQGFDRSPRSTASKILSCFWMGFVTFVLVVYIGSSYNHLFWMSTGLPPFGHSSGKPPIRNFRDLVKREHGYSYGTINGSSIYKYFTQDPILEEYKEMKRYWDEMGSTMHVTDNDEGILKVRTDEKYGFITDELVARYISNQKPCNTLTVGRVGQRSYGFAMAPGSPYFEHFHEAILEMTEAGDIEALEEKWYKDKGECWKDDTLEEDQTNIHIFRFGQISLKNVMSVLIFLACGLFLSGVAAAAEILYFKYRGRYEELQRHSKTDSTLVSS